MSTTRLAKVTTLLRPQRFPLLVSGGRVACPRHIFDVEVDRWFGCELFEGGGRGQRHVGAVPRGPRPPRP